jgi:hypothetical protein
MVLAGGVLFAGCNEKVGDSGLPPGVPCGNASPDPCICGRPEASAAAYAECQADRACVAAGGVWRAGTYSDQSGVTRASYCETDGGTDDVPFADGGTDGNDAD